MGEVHHAVTLRNSVDGSWISEIIEMCGGAVIVLLSFGDELALSIDRSR
jgi:hypothetical protein